MSLSKPHPCNFETAALARSVAEAGAAERPSHPRTTKSAAQHGSSAAHPLSPNSRQGRKPSPFRQGGAGMETNTQPVFVGIDVSKNKLDVALWPSGEGFAVERNAKGLNSLCAKLAALNPVTIALEATGGFETVVAAALAAASLPVAVVNPAQVRAFAQALGQRAKTDPLDAAVIARFAEAASPHLSFRRHGPKPSSWPISSPGAADLEHDPAETCRIEHASLKAVRVSLESHLAALKMHRRRKTKTFDRAPAKRLKKSDRTSLESLGLAKEPFKPQRRISHTGRRSGPRRFVARGEREEYPVPGVGPTTARTLIAELPELGTSDAQLRNRGAGRVFAPSRASPDSGGERASSKEAEQACAPPCSWRRWSRQGSILS